MSKLAFAAAITVAFMFLCVLFSGCYVGEVDSNDSIPECTAWETRDCTTSCGTWGTSTCSSSGYWGFCVPTTDEICGNNFDDNCNGAVDEGCGSCRDGDTRPCGTNTGACELGVQICSGGSWGDACVGGVSPRTETCNGVDDDCNGTSDEGCLCENGESRPCGSDVGACAFGVEICTGNAWGSCIGGVTPRAETCSNGSDDDCDGSIDEDCGVCTPWATETCTTTCGTNGTRTCSSSGEWNTCQPPVEICNGFDDNCNGVVDEGCGCVHGSTRSCGSDVGQCLSGTETCSFGSWGSCVGSVGPTTETCNGVDDNCNGTTDEGCSCTNGATRSCGSSVGICTTGTETCSGGVWGTCSGSVSPRTETCNGVDDDCDGTTDEGCSCVNGATRSCGTSTGACTTGTETCYSGSWGGCVGGIGPRTETCNGIDDNCNGSVDEGSVCTPSCVPTTEICNGVDDDCDGVVDEDALGNEFVGDEICFSFGPDMPPLATAGGATVTLAELSIFGCPGSPMSRYSSSSGTGVCMPLRSAYNCNGWGLGTYSEGDFADENNIGTWHSPSGSSYIGLRADDPRLSGTLTSASNIRVFARRPGRADLELTDRSWIVYDPSGARFSPYARYHSGERVGRIAVPVHGACALPGEYPPDLW